MITAAAVCFFPCRFDAQLSGRAKSDCSTLEESGFPSRLGQSEKRETNPLFRMACADAILVGAGDRLGRDYGSARFGHPHNTSELGRRLRDHGRACAHRLTRATSVLDVLSPH